MRVICLVTPNTGTVDECIVVNDDEEQGVIERLANANDSLPKEDRIHIASLTPTQDVETLVTWIKTP